MRFECLHSNIYHTIELEGASASGLRTDLNFQAIKASGIGIALETSQPVEKSEW
jgi:hypothetical protein